jgi:HK97 family phage prohead protease
LIEPRFATHNRALPHEAKFTALDMKSVADDGAFEGYASLFGREDLGRDIVMPGAFRDTLAARGADGVRMLFQHNPAEPIGIWETLAEDAKGLFARGRLMPTVTRAREVLALMRAGAIDGLSIGFRTVKAHRDRARGVRRIERIDLWEISIVTFPLLPEARITTGKARPFSRRQPSEREFERWLTQDAGLTRTQARAVLRSGFKGLAALRDAAASPSEDARLANRCAAVAAYLRSTTAI